MESLWKLEKEDIQGPNNLLFKNKSVIKKII